MFYLHRKALAENIEKARRADPEKEKEKEEAEKIKALANRKQYLKMQAEKKKA